MPRHKQVTTCRKSDGPLSNMCSCEHCCLDVCAVCGTAEGSLTTDCSGSNVSHERQQEIYETTLDYTDERGWHLGEPMARRSPRFESTKLPPEQPRTDPRAAIAPLIDWAVVDRTVTLQHDLSQKAIDWVLADRVADEYSATLTRLEDEIDEHLPKGEAPNAHAQELLKSLEYEKIGCRVANQRAEKCDDEFRQAARTLVTTLEGAACPPHIVPRAVLPKSP